ncbi:MAG: hypothetical protein JRN26_01340 [Nitrososphaerota archaeon]|nr:hypothetical protein [Nitrososphaerota archaeon]MDG6932692.1 hypothetical protein [Nitrososphaerota archaeon]MDG6935522.1 hypothetical protein [Nitrososphaerota archaeon]MDG6943417.1 hypothetical protein [Nitrososphaerota archaeon]
MKCLENNIERRLIGLNYIVSEKSREKADGIVKLHELLNDLYDDEEVKHLVKNLSETRKNGVYDAIYIQDYIWKICQIGYDELRLSFINYKVNPLLIKANFKLSEVCNMLKEQPTLMEELNDNGKAIRYSALLCIRNSVKISIIDGNHRAIVLYCRGITELFCYIGFKQ